jgi:hypothetical protein
MRKIINYKDFDAKNIIGNCTSKSLPNNKRSKYYAIDRKYKVQANREVPCYIELPLMFSPFVVRNKLETSSEEKKYRWFMRFEIDENLEEHRQFRNTWEKLMDKIHSIVKDSLKKSYSISDPIYLLREEKFPGKLPSI